MSWLLFPASFPPVAFGVGSPLLLIRHFVPLLKREDEFMEASDKVTD